LELANEINEPLTGRKHEYRIFPLSMQEMVAHADLLTEIRNLNHRLVYGYYPEVVTSPGQEKRVLSSVAGSYLYKDLLSYDKIKKPSLLDKLIRALALQVGSEVSFNEVAQLIGVDKGTVERYIDLLEKAFVIFRLDAFSRNVRNEIKKTKKVYFYDNGILNAVLGNYTPVELRKDIGALWENFIISERQKYNHDRGFYGKSYFWRTTQQQEIDYIEEVDGAIDAFEIKWNPLKKVRFSKTFLNAYEVRSAQVITPENYYEHLINW
jgi:predicted AAA+ superfamily ATPase